MEEKDYSVFYDMMYQSRLIKAGIRSLIRNIESLYEGLPPAQHPDLKLYAESITDRIDDLKGDIDGYSSICIQRAAEHLATKLEASK